MQDLALDRAAQAIAVADAFLIGAGAGMGVDSGLPDFRGKEGFWNAYPPYQRLGLDFVALANPRWFVEDPTLAWGFYGHRMGLYRQTSPHEGFSILRRWASAARSGSFVFTSNVDGQFQRAGFDPEAIVEVHGSFDGMQCTRDCGSGIFGGESFHVEIDPDSMRAIHPLPSCPQCGALARPNILMFGDWGWDSARTEIQMCRLNDWIESQEGSRLVVIECGAGQAIPTVRITCEKIARQDCGILLRINPREPDVPSGHVSLPMGALSALRALDERLNVSQGDEVLAGKP
jgi:NAD-dependent SIR2 family protein deacetylase